MRLLTASDIAGVHALSHAAGWNQTAADWLRLIELEPPSCFCIEEEDRVVATTTLLTYGSDMAWVGMVLTHPSCQRRGYARQLVTAALELAGARGIPCIKLDATDEGKPLYRSLGFDDEQPIERWTRNPGPVAPSDPVSTGPIPRQEDRLAFGVDRWKFISTLGAPAILDGGYVLHRPGSRGHYLGPCIARNTATAHQLIASTLGLDPQSPWYWDLLPSNPAAVALARNFDFQPVRRLTRMIRGEPIRGEDSMVFAIGAFEAG